MAIAESNSWERTRKELGATSVTSVMHLLNRMATTLGRGPLVAGKGDSVKPTSLGREYLNAAELLTSAFESFEIPTSQLLVGGYPIHAAILVPLIASFLHSYDGAEVKFHNVSDEWRNDRGAELIQQLLVGELDLIVAPSGRSNAFLREKELYEWNLRVALSNSDELRDRKEVRITELKDYRFLLAPHGHMSRELFDEIAVESNVRANIYMEVSDQNVLREVAMHFQKCAAIIPDDAFGLPNAQLGPVLTKKKSSNLRRSYSLYYKRRVANDSQLIRRRKQEIDSLVNWITDNLPRAD